MLNISNKALALYYEWSLDNTNKLMEEYEKFLMLRYLDNKLSPPNDIDKIWHFHILSTKQYNEYCIKKFGKMIHHDPVDSFDQQAKKKRLENTIELYKKKYGSFKYPNIWSDKKETILKLPPLTISLKSNYIGVFVYYTFDINNGVRIWKPNHNQHDRKILAYYCRPTSTIESLQHLISKTTGHHWSAVRIYFHPNSKIKLKTIHPSACQTGYKAEAKPGWINTIDSDVNLIALLSYSKNLLIAELEEMTSNGYC